MAREAIPKSGDGLIRELPALSARSMGRHETALEPRDLMDWYIQAIYAPLILIFGLSHLAQPRLWADFFIAMKRTGFAPLIIGMYTLPTGLILIVGHNRWVLDWPLFITLSGWGMTLKSVVYLLFPGAPDRLVAEPERLLDRHVWVFRVVGLIMVLFGGILTWHAFAERLAHP